jgi:hypothetical protein
MVILASNSSNSLGSVTGTAPLWSGSKFIFWSKARYIKYAFGSLGSYPCNWSAKNYATDREGALAGLANAPTPASPGGITPAPWVTMLVYISKNFYALREQDK